MAANFADNIFKIIFLNEKCCILIKISPKCVPKGSINNKPALVQIRACRRTGNRPLSEKFTDAYIYASLSFNELNKL